MKAQIFEDIASLFTQLNNLQSAAKIGSLFNKDYRWVHKLQHKGSFILNDDFVKGLNTIGYDIKLIRREEENDKL